MEELCSNCNVIYCANTNENSNTSLHPSLSGIAWQTYTSWAENTLCPSSLSLSDMMLGRQFSSTISTAVIWLLQTPHFIIQPFYSTSTLALYSLLVKPALSLPPPLRSILREPSKTFGSPRNIVHICKDGLLQRGFGQDRLQLRCSKKIWSEAIIVMLISAGWLVIGISRSAALYLHYNFFSHQYNVYNYYKCYYHY